jgi:hypothetical protein
MSGGGGSVPKIGRQMEGGHRRPCSPELDVHCPLLHEQLGTLCKIIPRGPMQCRVVVLVPHLRQTPHQLLVRRRRVAHAAIPRTLSSLFSLSLPLAFGSVSLCSPIRRPLPSFPPSLVHEESQHAGCRPVVAALLDREADDGVAGEDAIPAVQQSAKGGQVAIRRGLVRNPVALAPQVDLCIRECPVCWCERPIYRGSYELLLGEEGTDGRSRSLM